MNQSPVEKNNSDDAITTIMVQDPPAPNTDRYYMLDDLAKRGDAKAQYDLGNKYYHGEDESQDYAKAVRLFRLAAEQKHATAQLALGVMYTNGEGESRDYAEAVRWYESAAEQGCSKAQHNLGAMYAEGKGVPQDKETAYMWFNLAASRSTGEDRDRAAKVRDKLAKRLTTEQLAEAQRRACEWDAAHPR